MEVLIAQNQALHQPAEFASSEALRQWLSYTQQIDVTYNMLSAIVRTCFKARRKISRPSRKKTP